MNSPAALEPAGVRRNPMEQARKNARVLGKHIHEAGIVPTADFASVSKSTVSAWFNDNRDAMGAALAFMGLKVVSISKQCYDPDEVEAIFRLAQRRMASMRSAEDLDFDDERE